MKWSCEAIIGLRSFLDIPNMLSVCPGTFTGAALTSLSFVSRLMNLGEGLLADKPEDETLILCLRARQLYRLISCDATQVEQDTMQVCVCVCVCLW